MTGSNSRNTGALFMESIARMGAGFVVGIMIARQYGPDGLGLITTANSWVVIFLGFSALGLSGILVRDLVERAEMRGAIIMTVALAKLSAGAVLLVSLLATLNFVSNDPSIQGVALIMGLGYLFSSLDTVDCLYNARVEFIRLVALRVSGLTVSSAFKVLAIYLDWGLEFVAVGYALDYALMYLLPTLDLLLRRRHGIRDGEIRLSLAPAELSRLLSRSWPVLLSGGLAQINLKIDIVMVSMLASVSNAGIYSAAARLSEAWSVLAMAMVTAAFPHLVVLARSNVDQYADRLTALLRRLIWTATAGAVVVAISAQWIIQMLYGEQFSASASVLSVHILAGVFLFVRTAVSRWLIVEDLLIFSLYSHAVGAIVNIAVNLIAIPNFGVVGAAWASVASYAFSSVLFLAITKRTRPMLKLILLSALPESISRDKARSIGREMESNRKVMV